MKNLTSRYPQPKDSLAHASATSTSLFKVGKAFALALCSLGLVTSTLGAVPEPETVLFGKIVNRTWGQPFLVTTGKLSLTVALQNGTSQVMEAPLKKLNGGEFSYELRVPHQALSLGLTTATNVIPLRADLARLDLLEATVDGSPALILKPGIGQFPVAQATRGATYRVDFEVFNSLLDSDGDGIPDWWEILHGMDPFFAGDANGDRDGDGWSNLVEFQKGTDPNKNNRGPVLQETELLIYSDATSVLLPKAIDADSSSAQLVYTITSLPSSGTVFLRNGILNETNSDLALNVGSTFNQQDVDQSRLVFKQTGNASSARLDVSLKDENPDHKAFLGTLNLIAFRPNDPAIVATLTNAATNFLRGKFTANASADEQLILNYLLGRDFDYALADVSLSALPRDVQAPSAQTTRETYFSNYVPSFGRDRRHLLLGTSGNDQLTGGMEDDVLIVHAGSDTLRGNAGADVFVFVGKKNAAHVIQDFAAGDQDVIDLSQLFDSGSGFLTNHVRLTTNGTDSVLGINLAGQGAPFTNLTITLKGVQTTLEALVGDGSLVAGNKVMTPKVGITATVAAASENGPLPGVFTLTRVGSPQAELTVNLSVSGSAVNGTDYEQIPNSVTFEAGARTAQIIINPLVSPNTFFTQMVSVAVSAGANYQVATPNSAQVSIEPLMPQVTIETLEGIAVKNSSQPGAFLVTRGGLVDRSVLVKLQISGAAANNTDYTGVPTFINFASQQATAIIYVNPKSTAVLSGGVEDVVVKIATDAAYKIMSPSVAHVLIVEELMDLATWRQRYFPGSIGDLASFARGDHGNRGVANLYRYAFGLDPLNPQTSSNKPKVEIKNGRMELSFRRPAGITDVDYFVETSNDLAAWRSSEADLDSVTVTNNLESVTYRAKKSTGEEPKQFIRLRVDLK